MNSDVPPSEVGKPLHPEVTWAQRSSKDDASKNFLWLTILASDVADKDMKLDVQPSKVTFEGYSSSKKANYGVALEFYAEIDPAASKVHHSARDIELKLQKKDLSEEYWPRLLKESKKMHFLKTDFEKWVDEDEQDGVPDDDYMNQFGGMPGMGMGGADGGFGGLDFSKLGGGAGGMDFGGEGGDDSDEEVPDLEDEGGVDKEETGEDVEVIPEATGSTGASATKTSKIEEVE